MRVSHQPVLDRSQGGNCLLERFSQYTHATFDNGPGKVGQ